MRSSSNNALAVIIVTLAAFIGGGVWWIESRFGSTTTVLVLGGLFGVVCLIIGYVLNMASTKHTLLAAADFNRDVASVEKYRQQAFREFARGDAAERKAQSVLTVIDARRVEQLAQRRAALLVDVERQKWEGQQQKAKAPQWAVEDEGDGTFSEWE